MTRAHPRVVVLAGGVGGSRFVLGMRAALRARGAADTAASLTVVINTGDDLWLSGVRLQPDVDSMVYALAGVNDTERGWGRAGESERVAQELHAWGSGWPWFTLGDLDLGTHLARTGWLRDGLAPTEVVRRLSARWSLGATLLPMTDSEVDTQVVVRGEDGAERRLHFQEWWTRYRARWSPVRFENPGIAQARPAEDVTQAIAQADAIVLAPSNPVVSIGPILAVPGVRQALAAATAPTVGVSPIIGGQVVRGMADICLSAIGVETNAAAVAEHYGARRRGGLLDTWLLADEDAALAARVHEASVTPVVAPLWMRDEPTAAELAERTLRAAGL